MSYDNLDVDFEEALYRVFRRFIIQFLPEEKVFMSNSGFTAPKGAYTTVGIEQIDPISWDRGAAFQQWNAEEERLETSTYSAYVSTITIMCFGEKSMSKTLGIKNALRDRSLAGILSRNGVGYLSSSNVYDVSKSMDNSSIERAAMFTVRLNFTIGGPDRGPTSGVVETVEGVTGTYNP